MNKDEALNKKAENAKELRLDYEPAQPYKGIADHTNQVTNGRMRIDPVTGDVGIGTPSLPQQKNLAQPEQEPVAWIDEYGNAFPLAAKQYSVVGKHWRPLYTTPPQRTWVGLTDEEMHGCWDSPLTPLGMKHARMIEAKLKEKNT